MSPPMKVGPTRLFDDAPPNQKPARTSQISLPSKIWNRAQEITQQSLDAVESLWEFRADALMIEGEEKHSGEPLTTLYFGSGENLPYLQGILYRDCRTNALTHGVMSFQAGRFVEKPPAAADLLVVDVNWPYDRRLSQPGFLRLPAYVEQMLTVPDTWEQIQKSFGRNLKKTKLRKIRQHQLGFRLNFSTAALTHFYHQMYIPHLRQRHGSSAYIESESVVMRTGRAGMLIEIVRNERVIASGLLVDSHDTLSLIWAGVAQDLPAGQLEGAFAALYYFTIVHGYELGSRFIWFGQSRPLVTDGVFRFKRQWRTWVMPTTEVLGDILIRPLGFTIPIQSVLANNCLVVKTPAGLVAKILLTGSTATAADIRTAVRAYATEGLAKLVIFSMAGFDKTCRDAIDHESFTVELNDLSDSSHPARTYSRS